MKPSEQARIERNRPLHESPGYAPVVGRGVSKTALPPERIRELLDQSRRRAEGEDERDDAPPKFDWSAAVDGAVFPSKRRLSSYNDAEQRVLEMRLFHGRNTYGKTDVQLSAELDVALEDFGDLAAVVRRCY